MLNLGDVHVAQGNEKEAAGVWERLIQLAPDRAYLAFDRLDARWRREPAIRNGLPVSAGGSSTRSSGLACAAAPSRHLTKGGHAQEALDLLFAALVQNPHALKHSPGDLAGARPACAIRQHCVDRYGALTEHAVFYLDPHVCMRCRLSKH